MNHQIAHVNAGRKVRENGSLFVQPESGDTLWSAVHRFCKVAISVGRWKVNRR